MRSDIAGNLHQDVHKAFNNINILSKIATLKADKDIEKIERTYSADTY